MSRTARRTRTLRHAVSPAIEQMEPRRLLAAVAWDGGGDGVNFSSANNWSTNAVPGAGDDVTISVAGSPSIVANGAFSFKSLVCDEALTMPAGSLSLAEASSINSSFAFNGGSLTGAGTVSFNGTVTWTANATMTGGGTTTFAAGSVVTVNPGTNNEVYLLQTRVVENLGTINWTSGRITFGDTAALVNKVGGTFNINGGQSFSRPSGAATSALTNQGTVNKEGSSAFSMTINNFIFLNNTGTVNVNAGTFTVNSAGTNSSTMNVASGATLLFNNVYTHADGSQLSGAGTVNFAAADQTASGTATVNAPLLFNGGAMSGGGTWQINGSMTWTANATMTGSGTTLFAAGSVVTINPGANNAVFLLQSRVVENLGTINWASGRIQFGDTAALVNNVGGIFNINGGQSFSATFVSGTPALTNQGTVNKEGNSAFSMTINNFIFLNNTGTVNVNAGTFNVNAGGTNSSTMTVASGATLVFNNIYTHADGSLLAGTAGSIHFAGSSQTVPTGATATVSGPLLVDNGAVMTGAGEWLITGNMTWNGNSEMRGAGKTTFASTAVITVNPTSFVRAFRAVDNFGEVNWTSGQFFGFGVGPWHNKAGAEFNISGTGARNFSNDGVGGSFINDGTINQTSGVTTNFNNGGILMPLINNSAVNVSAGTFVIDGGGTNNNTMTSSSTGEIRFTANYTHANGSLLAGTAGSIRFSGGSQTVPTGATATVSGPLLVDNGAIMTGAGEWLITGNMTWNGNSEMRGAGKTTFASTAVITVNPTSFVRAFRAVDNFGEVNWTSGQFFGFGVGPWHNKAGAEFNISGTGARNFSNDGVGGSFINDGTINQTSGVTTNFNNGGILMPLINNSVINISAGGFTVDGGTPQVVGNTLAGGAWNVFGTGTLTIPGASLSTIGAAASVRLDGPTSTFVAINPLSTINGTFRLSGGRDFSSGAMTNNGTLNLGAGSILSASGTYTQGTGGTLVTALAGPNASTDFGRIAATGVITLAGTLTPALVGAYDPAFTQNFNIVTGSSRSGTFTTFTGGTTPSGRPLRARYGPGLAVIGVAPLSPSTADLTAASDSGISDSDNITNNATPTFSGTAEDGTTVLLYADGVQVGSAVVSGGTFNLTTSVLSDGVYVITAKSEDSDPDLSDASPLMTLTIDTTAPAAPAVMDLQTGSDSGVSPTDDITNDNTPSLDFASTDDYLRITRNTAQITSDYATGTSLTESTLADGSYDYVIRGVDAAGNVSAASPTLNVVIDTVAPAAPAAPDLQAASDSGVSDTDNITNDNTPTFDIVSTDTYYRMFRDFPPPISALYATSPTFTDVPQGDAPSRFYFLRAVDAAGNESSQSAMLEIRIDTTAPAVPVAPDLRSASDSGFSDTDNITNDNTPTFDVITSDLYFRFERNGTQVSADYEAGSNYTAAAQADGTFDFSVRAVDAAGNASAAGSALSVNFDTAAPTAPAAPDLQTGSDSGVSGSDDITNDATPSIDFASTDAYLRLSRDGAQITSDYATGTTFTDSAQLDGAHDYVIRGVDGAGNVSAPSSTLTVTIDTVAPAVPAAPDMQAASDSGVSQTDNITNDTTPTYNVASTDAYFRVEEDGFGSPSGLYESGTTFTPAASVDRQTFIRIRGVDAAGNVSAASAGLLFFIDTFAPFSAPPPGLFASSDTGVSSSDRITADNTPTFSVPGDPGDYFQFLRDGVQISGDYQSGTSYTTPVQPDGTFVYNSRPVDAAGNVGLPGNVPMSVTIDTVAPATPSAPDLRSASDSGVSDADDITNDNTPTFDLASTDAYFRFERDGVKISGDYAAGIDFTTALIADGAGEFAVRGVDAAGNVSAASAALSVTIDTVAPAAPAIPDLEDISDTGVSNSDNITNDTTPTLNITSSDTYYRLLRNGTQVSGDFATGAFASAALTDGESTFAAVSVDAAGNASSNGPELVVQIDTAGLAAPVREFQFELGHALQFVFGENVGASLVAGDVLVQSLPGGPTFAASLSYTNPTATFTFSGPPGGILPDGNYRATIAAGNVSDVAGNPLPGDVVLDFFVFAGDANRDRVVNISDFSILAARFNLPGTFSQGDFNYNGSTEIGDFAILASKFNQSLPAVRASARSQFRTLSANEASTIRGIESSRREGAPRLFAATFSDSKTPIVFAMEEKLPNVSVSVTAPFWVPRS